MTTLQKTLVTATVAVLAGAGIYEARQAAQLREQVQTLQQQQAPLAERLQQFQKELEEAVNQQVALRADNERLGRNTTELLELRGEVTRLRAVAQLPQSKSGDFNDAIRAMADAWAKQAYSFKKWFEENPEKSIPELALLKDADWLFEASRNLQVFTNRSEGNDMHMIADSLRTKAKERFARQMGHALSSYIVSHGGELPDELSQLMPYFAGEGSAPPMATSLGTAIVRRYELLRTGLVQEVAPSEPIIREKAPVDDVIDSVVSIMVGSYAMQSTGKVTDMMRQGQPIGWARDDVEKIKPFLKSE